MKLFTTSTALAKLGPEARIPTKVFESGTVDLAPFITGRIGLDDLVTVGYDTLLHHNETAVKILVSPSGAGLPAAV